jgi:hypothetical protein
MGQKSHLYLLSFACQRTLQLPFAICLERIRAHGWDPLVPSATGIYDGPQEALLLVDGARKLAAGAKLTWEQTVLVRGE